MPLADYFARSSLAASQVLEGFDLDRFRERLSSTSVGIAFSPEAVDTPEGRALLDLAVRLTARLYPKLDLWCPDTDRLTASKLATLAAAINPAIEVTHLGQADSGIVVGECEAPFANAIYAGSSGWDAHLSSSRPCACGASENPFGAGAAASFAVANLFRRVFLDDWSSRIDNELVFSTYSFTKAPTPASVPNEGWQLDADAVLGGVGAVGMAAVWALSRAPLDGVLHLVDPEVLELSNLQRYVLAELDDVDRQKVSVAARGVDRARLKLVEHPVSWDAFVSAAGYHWSWALAAFDSAGARRALQASLPKWIANAWTQPGDLGVSVHPQFDGPGACLACLYLPDAKSRNEDEIVAEALGLPGRVAEIRNLLHLGGPVPPQLLIEMSAVRGIDPGAALTFQGRTIRDVYVEGICGGALIDLGRSGQPPQAVHVPLAHQSALAGVLLAARLARASAGGPYAATSVIRLDLLRRLPDEMDQPAMRRGDGRCLCDDGDFVGTYRTKYGL